MQNKRLMRKSRLGRIALVLACLFAISAVPAYADLLTIDQIIYQDGTGVDPGGLSGTLDVSISGTTLTVLMKNTSADSAFTSSDSPALMLLTGFGLQLTGVDILSGSVEVGATSTALNFDSGQSLTVITNQWSYANASIDGYTSTGVVVDSIVTSVNNGGATRFSSEPYDPGNIDGPGYGALSSLETQFGSSTPGVQNTIKFVLNLSGAITFNQINAGNVVLAFGSPETLSTVPEPSTYALYALGISMLVVSGWWQKRRSQTADLAL